MGAICCLIQPQMLADLTQRAQKVCNFAFFKSLTYTYIIINFNAKAAPNYVNHPDNSGQPDHYQGEAVEPGKCIILV